MFDLFKDKNYVTSSKVGNLLSFTFYYDCVSGLVTLFNGKGDIFGIFNRSLSTTLLASLSTSFSLTSTSGTLCLHLHLHSKTHLNVLHYDSLTFALWTCFELAVFGSGTTTFVTVYISANRNRPLSTVVHILQMNVHFNSKAWSSSHLSMAAIKVQKYRY